MQQQRRRMRRRMMRAMSRKIHQKSASELDATDTGGTARTKNNKNSAILTILISQISLYITNTGI